MRILVAVLSWLCLAAPVLATGFDRGTVPVWVNELAIPSAPADLLPLAEDGIFFLLSDYQLSWDGDDDIAYQRTTIQVTDRAGLEEAAAVSFDFDPLFETVTLTRLHVIRGGQITDYTTTLAEEVFRRETRLEQGIIDGSLTAFLQVPDLRVGDIVDYASVRRSKPLVAGTSYAGQVYMEYFVPVALRQFVLHWPKGMPLHLGDLPDRVAYAKTTSADGGTRHVWRRDNHQPFKMEDDAPRDADPSALIRFSAYADWSPVVAALAPFYSADYPLTPEWAARVDAITKDHATDDLRAAAALRMVQEELRYVSLSVGAGGIFARLPAEVITSGFGDCKDNALLLRVMLARMGITAHVALTDIDEGYDLVAVRPMLGAFDHAITRVMLGQRSVFVDPTGTHEGGTLVTAAPPDYGWALPLTGPGQTALEKIMIDPQTQWRVEVDEAFSFGLPGVFLDVTTVYSGASANSTRERWATTAQGEISADYLEFYTRRYPGIREVRPASIADDRNQNRLVLTESYFLPAPALFQNDLRENFAFAAEDFASNLPDTLVGTRKMPLFAGAPSAHVHRVTVNNAPIEFTPPDAVTIKNDAFDFRFSGRADTNGQMELNWEYTRGAQVIAADAVEGVIDDARAVEDNTYFTWDLTPDPKD